MWETLDNAKKAYIMQQAISEGITSLSDIKNYYAKKGKKLLKTFATGGNTNNPRVDRYVNSTPSINPKTVKYLEEDQSSPISIEVTPAAIDNTRVVTPVVEKAIAQDEQQEKELDTLDDNDNNDTFWGTDKTSSDRFKAFAENVFPALYKINIERGIDHQQALYLAKLETAQLALESQYGWHRDVDRDVFRQAHNLGGVKWFPSMGENVKYVIAPDKEKYVSFDSYNDFYNFYLNQLYRNWGIDKLQLTGDIVADAEMYATALHPKKTGTAPLSDKYKGDYSEGYEGYRNLANYKSLFNQINPLIEMLQKAYDEAHNSHAYGGKLKRNLFVTGGNTQIPNSADYQSVSFEPGTTSIPVVSSNDAQSVFNYYLQGLQNAGYKGINLYDLADQYTKSAVTENIPTALPYDVVVTGNRNEYLAAKQKAAQEAENATKIEAARQEFREKYHREPTSIELSGVLRKTDATQQLSQLEELHNRPTPSSSAEQIAALNEYPSQGIDFNFLNNNVGTNVPIYMRDGQIFNPVVERQKLLDQAKEVGYWLPYVGDALAINDIKNDFQAGDYGSAALMAGLMAIPYGNDVRRLFTRGVNKIRRGINSIRPSYLRNQIRRAEDIDRSLINRANALRDDRLNLIEKHGDIEGQEIKDLSRQYYNPNHEYNTEEELIDAILNGGLIHEFFPVKNYLPEFELSSLESKTNLLSSLLSGDSEEDIIKAAIGRFSDASIPAEVIELWKQPEFKNRSFSDILTEVAKKRESQRIPGMRRYRKGYLKDYILKSVSEVLSPSISAAEVNNLTREGLVTLLKEQEEPLKKWLGEKLRKDLPIEKTPNGKFKIDKRGNVIVGARSLSVSPRGRNIDTFISVQNGMSLPSIKSGQNVTISDLVPTKLGNKSATVEQVTRENIDELQNMFPGSVVYGSSTLTSNGVSTFIPHDYEMYITPSMVSDIEKKVGKKLNFNDAGTASVDLNINGVTVPLDINRISFESTQRASSLFSYLHPEDAFKINKEMADLAGGEWRNSTDTDLAERLEDYWRKRVKELGYSPEKILKETQAKGDIFTIVDNLQSAKGKHVARLPFILNETPTNKLVEGINTYIKSQSKTGLRSEVQFGVDAFRDVDQNRQLFRAFLDENTNNNLGKLGDVLNEEVFVNDPERMQALYNYFMFTNSTVYRGVSNKNRYLNRGWNKTDMFEWFPETQGGTGHGVGLNLVIGGSAGPSYGPIRMSTQLPVPRGNSPLETWQNINKVIAYSSNPLSQEQKEIVKALASKHKITSDINIDDVLQSNTASFSDVLQQTACHSGQKYADFLKDVQTEFGWAVTNPSTSRRKFTGLKQIYGSGFYGSGIPNLAENETTSFFNPLYMGDFNNGYIGLDIGSNPFVKFGDLIINDGRSIPYSERPTTIFGFENTWNPLIEHATNYNKRVIERFKKGYYDGQVIPDINSSLLYYPDVDPTKPFYKRGALLGQQHLQELYPLDNEIQRLNDQRLRVKRVKKKIQDNRPIDNLLKKLGLRKKTSHGDFAYGGYIQNQDSIKNRMYGLYNSVILPQQDNLTVQRILQPAARYLDNGNQRSTVMLGSYGNYVSPSIMQNNQGRLEYVGNNPWQSGLPMDSVASQSIRFNNADDARFFGENYHAYPELFQGLTFTPDARSEGRIKSTGGPLYPFSFSKDINVKTPVVRYDNGGGMGGSGVDGYIGGIKGFAEILQGVQQVKKRQEFEDNMMEHMGSIDSDKLIGFQYPSNLIGYQYKYGGKYKDLL